MSARRSLRFLRGLAALLATCGLLVGVPALLIAAVGSPLPSALPTLDALSRSARSGISDEVVVNTLAVIVWLAWSQLMLALAVEIVAVARREQAPRLPVLPGFQPAAARLVAGILMITAAFQPGRAQALVPPISVAATARNAQAAEVTVPTPEALSQSSPIDQWRLAPAPAADDHPTITVHRHDSYWEIAERTLGDGLRWREILDLNVGRTMPDGTTIAAGSDVLHTGWVLRLPTDAAVDHEESVGLTPGADPSLAASPASVVVESGDNLWTISEHHLEGDLGRDVEDREVAPYWREVIDANADRYIEPGNPNLIIPGQVLALPPTGFEAPPADRQSPVAEAPVPTDPTSPTETRPSTSTTATTLRPESAPPDAPATSVQPSGSGAPVVAPSEDAEDDPTDVAVPLALGGLSSVALAVGLKRLLDRRRRRFANAHQGELPGRTPADQEPLHHAVVAQADEDQIDDLQGVLGWLAMHLAHASSERRPRMIRHSVTGIELLIDQPARDAAPGWVSNEAGTVWTLVDPPDLDEPYDGPMCPTPLLVTIGQPEDDAQLYLDLEADGLLALRGDADVAADLARSLVTELALSPLADTIRVIAIGDVVDPEAKILDHLTILDSWDGVSEDLAGWARQSHDTLAEKGWASTFVGRGHEPDHDALIPIAVVADQPPPDELTSALRDALPSAVAVVVVGAFEGAVATIECEPDALNFEPVDLACSPQAVTSDELADMCRLLVATDSADELELMNELQAEYDEIAGANGSIDDARPSVAQEETDALDRGGDDPPDFEVLVRLLGDIVVEGGKPLNPKPTAVVAYLAVHRTVTTERLEEACWFGADGTSHRKRLRDTMTECRAALGSQHFPANRSSAYVAGPMVRTDCELFDWHVGRAVCLDPVEAIEHYRAALNLVTGRPFSYPNAARASYGWVDFEHHATSWEYRVGSIAQACTELHLDRGEPAEAIAMLREIIKAIPLNSAVVEALMRAHIADDDRAGAERVYKEHAAALEQAGLGDPEDSIERLLLDARSS